MKQILIILLVVTNFGWSQDYATEIKRITTEFSALESYQIEALVSVSGDEDFSFKASVKASNFGSWVVTDNTEILVNKAYTVSIDHEDKTIRVDKGNFKVKSSGREQMGLDLADNESEDVKTIKYLGRTADYRTYVLFQNSDISKTVVKISNTTNFFHEIEVFYDSDDISIASYKVKYTLFKKNPTFKVSDFSETHFFTKNENGSLQATPAYKEYTLIKQY